MTHTRQSRITPDGEPHGGREAGPHGRQEAGSYSGQKGGPRGDRWHWLFTLAALLTIGWLAVGAFGGAKIGGLTSVASNNSSDYLPQSSEAAEVRAELADFRPNGAAPALPAIVVATRDGGITSADQTFLTTTLADFRSTLADSDTAGRPAPIGPSGSLRVSEDGAAAETVVAIPASADPGDAVTALRDALATAPPGLAVYVAGPAGQIADMVEAFSGIDGMLLVVAGIVVALILLVVYRGPLLVLLVLLSAVFALSGAALVVYHLASSGALQLSGMSQGILFILVFGAATDYALLLVSRYRQELRDQTRPLDAMRTAWRAVFAPVTASAATVIIGVLCLLFSDLASTRDLGPVAAIGIAAAYLASMTFLPAALLLCRRAPFWPLTPHPGTEHPETSGLWRRVSSSVEKHPRRIWIIVTLVLLGGVALAPQLQAHGTSKTDLFLTSVDSATGQQVLSEHFPGSTGSPTWIITEKGASEEVLAATRSADGVAGANLVPTPEGAAANESGRVRIRATLAASASSAPALEAVQRIRDAVHAVPGANALVGGQNALQLDTNLTSERDRSVIIPIVLVVVLIVLALLLRALLAPVVLIATVLLSYLATLGVAAFMFNNVFGFAGADPAVPLFAFVFLVALGIDYNIFLMTRVREEAIRAGTHRGTVHGLELTGGVITSAGVVLAATFAALAVLPILFMAQIAFLVAFGVLLDTVIVRSLLVPALTLEIGKKIWWPSKLSRGRD